jgi:hypothetical protein
MDMALEILLLVFVVRADGLFECWPGLPMRFMKLFDTSYEVRLSEFPSLITPAAAPGRSYSFNSLIYSTNSSVDFLTIKGSLPLASTSMDLLWLWKVYYATSILSWLRFCMFLISSPYLFGSM